MNYIINMRNVKHLIRVLEIPINEVLLQTRTFSRFGEIDDKDIDDCIFQLQSKGKKIVLAWDILLKDKNFKELENGFRRLSEQINTVRFLDPGVGRFLSQRFPDCRLQLSLEHGSHNKTAILGWSQVFGQRLERVILSNQIPISTIESITKIPNVKFEMLGIGRIEIFYSARHLLGNNHQNHASFTKHSIVASDDRPNQLSPVFENEHGTIMFYDKELFIMDDLDIIEKAGIDHLRLEFYKDKQYQIVKKTAMRGDWTDQLKKSLDIKTTKGFFKSNQTHKLFTFLTNRYITDNQKNSFGIVIEAVKNKFTLIETAKYLTLPISVNFSSPEGKKVNYIINKVKDLKGKCYTKSAPAGVYLLPWIKYIVPTSILCFRDDKIDATSHQREK